LSQDIKFPNILWTFYFTLNVNNLAEDVLADRQINPNLNITFYGESKNPESL